MLFLSKRKALNDGEKMQSCSQVKYMEVKGETSEELEESEKEHIKSCDSCMTAYLNKIDGIQVK